MDVQLSSPLDKIIRLYASRCFTVCVILMDMKFKKVMDELDLVTVNTSAARKHVAEIECGIRVTKERSRVIIANTPFKFLHKHVVMHLVYFTAYGSMRFWLGKESRSSTHHERD